MKISEKHKPNLGLEICSDDSLANEDSRRRKLIHVVGVIAVLILLVVAISSLIKGEVGIAVIDSLAAISSAIILLIYRFSSYTKECRYSAVMMMYCLYIYLFFSGGVEGMTYMWHYTFPLFAIFLIGANHGSIATLFLFIPVFIYVVNDALSPGQGFYNSDFAVRFIPSAFVALIFSYLFEQERVRFKRQTLEAYSKQEKIIAERTTQLKKEVNDRELIASKLRQSQKMEALGVMAGGVAHDLNNILAGVVSLPQVIRVSLPANSSLIAPLQTIESAGKRAASVVDDMLMIARDVASVKEAVHLNDIIAKFLRSPEWQRIGEMYPAVRVTQHLSPQLALISCSPMHIEKCLMNLLFNAVEASAPVGQVVISTGIDTNAKPNIEEDSGDTEYVYFSVQDSGPGIESEHLDHIFEPFYTTKKMGHSGSGLGLSVVWNTVKEHGGQIRTVDSIKGACFITLFPSLKNELLTPDSAVIVPLESLNGTGALLLLDDEPGVREVGSLMAKMFGYSVSLAQSGEEAIKIFKRSDFDVVVLDMLLGQGMNGRETYEQMLAIKPGQKAVIATGSTTSLELEKTLELGAHSIIQKPFTLEKFGCAIKECLNNS